MRIWRIPFGLRKSPPPLGALLMGGGKDLGEAVCWLIASAEVHIVADYRNGAPNYCPRYDATAWSGFPFREKKTDYDKAGSLVMPTKTRHVVPSDGGWVVRKEADTNLASLRSKDGNGVIKTGFKTGNQWSVRKPDVERSSSVSPTQKQAIDAAREMVHRSSSGQVVVHSRNGSMHWRDVHGLPEIQKPPRKSDLGTSAIKKAVSTVIRERLERE